MSLVKEISRMSWSEISAIQSLCNLRKQQLRMLESSVYVVRLTKTEYLGYLEGPEGSSQVKVVLNSNCLAVYPSYDIADYIRGQFEQSTVVKIPKTEFITLSVFGIMLKEGLVNEKGDFNT
jgi:hypothetical protein